MKILSGVVITIIILIAAFMLFIYSGWYNVSAMNEESGLMKWVFRTTKNNSIESRIGNIVVPDLNDNLKIKEGFEHYKAMCESCHGAPGKEETELSKGLNPPAPYLVDEAKETDARELFWVTKNGIRMTGMPAWGKTHTDDQIWNIVAFMKKLPDMSAEDYVKMENENEIMDDNPNHHGENVEHKHSHIDKEHHH